MSRLFKREREVLSRFVVIWEDGLDQQRTHQPRPPPQDKHLGWAQAGAPAGNDHIPSHVASHRGDGNARIAVMVRRARSRP